MPYWLQSIVYAVSICVSKIKTKTRTFHELLMIYWTILYVVKPFLGSVVCAISQPWFYISELFLEHQYYIQYTTECIQKCNIPIIFDPSAAHLRIMGFSEAWSRSAVSWICNELEPRIRIISDPAPDNCSSICKVSWSRAQPYSRHIISSALSVCFTAWGSLSAIISFITSCGSYLWY